LLLFVQPHVVTVMVVFGGAFGQSGRSAVSYVTGTGTSAVAAQPKASPLASRSIVGQGKYRTAQRLRRSAATGV
jgi:hypothetical protein